jgi:dipeptidyl aminopeptidase/acylaminoacyl peptidase
MRNRKRAYAWALACEVCVLSGILMPAIEAQTRAVTAKDCVSVKYVTGGGISGPVRISPEGTRIAYEVKAPDLTEGKNVFELYVKDLLHGEQRSNGVRIARGENFGGLQWRKDGHNLLMLAKNQNVVAINEFNVISGTEDTFFQAPASILEYALNRDEDMIVYSAAYRESGADLSKNIRSTKGAFSKLITVNRLFGDPEGIRRAVFVSRRSADGKWSAPQQIMVEDPFTQNPLKVFGELQHLSLSPDGRWLVFAYDAEAIPEGWKSHPYMKLIQDNGAPLIITVVHDLLNGRTTVPIRSGYAGTAAFWSEDSKGFAMTAPAPIDSVWEKRDIEEKRIAGLDANLYWINVETGEIEEIMARVPFHHQPPLAWTPAGDLVIKTYDKTISTFHHEKTSWTKIASVTLPFTRPYPFSQLTSDGKIVAGVYETAVVPPNLYTLELKTGRTEIITNLNPQLANATLAKANPVQWYTSDGMEIHGLLFMPTDYELGHRYPLVIQTKGQQDNSSFVCDSGVNHDPAFAPQPLANSGMMYLIRTVPEDYDQEKEIAHRQTSKYPNGIAEAVQQMDIWESGIQSLSAKGLIDPSRVGMIGFSRTGWYVEFMLAHSSFHFAAASVADNVEYSLGEYWLLHDASAGYDDIYGGPPYGPALENWIKYSISFNLDKVHTPLLMELMGHGVSNDIPGQIPPSLAAKYETLVGLNKLKRPAELYFFPNQGHMPDAPEARLESLQQNIDWFRFWLQGYEDPDPVKASQYGRWRLLRKEQEVGYLLH